MKNDMIRISIIILFLTLFTILSSGKSDKTIDSILTNEKSRKNINKNKEVLKVGTNAEYPPFEYKEDDKFVGIDMELAKILEEKLDMKLEILDMDFDALIPSLVANKIDVAMAAITITDKRKQRVDFSIPYYSCDLAIFATKDSEIEINEEKDLKKYSIGVQNRTTGQIYIYKKYIEKRDMKKAQLKKYVTNSEAVTDMINGNTDLVIIDSSAAKIYQKLKQIKIIYTIKIGESYGVAMSKDSPLKEDINTALKEILKSDWWIDILVKYIK